MAVLRDKDFLSAHCLRFTILTAARSGEARGAVWSEIDLNARIWTIPGSRMKAEREHRVPLCDEAMEILATMRQWRLGDAERIFPGSRGGLLSDVAINKALHAIAPTVTVHGFRSAFRDWGAETTSYSSAVLELALAHVNPNQVEAAYQRSDLFERRRELMVAWGKYCGTKQF
jgi:integrase